MAVVAAAVAAVVAEEGAGGGRGGGNRRDGDSKKPGTSTDEQTGEKRKRAVEPAGAPDTGVRGQAVPVIQSMKRVKTNDMAS